jgi:hypothetical protein
MGKVITLRPKSLLEFEDSALRKLGEIAELAIRLPDMIAELAESDAEGLVVAKRFVDLMTGLDEAIYALERFAPTVALGTDSDQRWIFEMQCDLSRLRVTAFVKVRCSIHYVYAFSMEELDATMWELTRRG